MTPNWTWTLDSQKYPVYTKNLPWGLNFGPFRSTDRGFQDIAHFIIPHWLPFWTPKKEQKNLPKIHNFKFRYSFNNFVRYSPQGYTF